MTYISPIEPKKTAKPSANYNAVKIQVNNPQTNIPEGFKGADEGIFNAVNIEVNKPSVNVRKTKPVYEYPKADKVVTYDMLATCPNCDIPVFPVAYQTNLVNNRTFIDAEIEFENKGCECPECKDCKPENKEEKVEQEPDIIPVIAEQVAVVAVMSDVPEPNPTTIEAEKKTSDITFNGISFKANNKIEIVEPVEIKPDIDMNMVLDKLNGSDLDAQAMQMEEIARLSLENPKNVIPYVLADMFTILIDITNKDTSKMARPSERQIEVRKQIIVNELVKEQAKSQGQEIKDDELPYQINDADMKMAIELTPMEQAERNKEYALYTIAILAKVFGDEVQAQTGNVVPLTDMPGISNVVDTLRSNENPGVKIAALDALRHVARPEYKDELYSVFNIAAKDENPYVSRNAIRASQYLEDLK